MLYANENHSFEVKKTSNNVFVNEKTFEDIEDYPYKPKISQGGDLTVLLKEKCYAL